MNNYSWEKIAFSVTIILMTSVSILHAADEESCDQSDPDCVCVYEGEGRWICHKKGLGDSCDPNQSGGAGTGQINGPGTGQVVFSCYCDDGPNGRENCRNYGSESTGFLLAAYAGWEMAPALRVNLTNFVSNTEPNIGEAECWDILNRRGEEFFIPTASQEEWNSFKEKVREGTLSGIIMNKCPSCGDGVCSNSATYWGYIEGCGSDDSMTPSIETGDPMCKTDCGACPISCGDGFCSAGVEDCTGGTGDNPCVDCGACACGDADYDCTGQCGTCVDCSPCCGDGKCDESEDNTTCVADCSAVSVCGDFICNGTETCEMADGSGHISGNACGKDCGVCSCMGTVPINSTLCPGDDSGLTANTARVSVTVCTPGTQCEYLCDAGTQFVKGECRYCAVTTGKDCFAGGDCSNLEDCSISDGCPVLGDYCRVDYTGDCSKDPCGDLYECQSCI